MLFLFKKIISRIDRKTHLKRHTYNFKYLIFPPKHRILVLGDSHCGVFEYIRDMNLLPKIYFQVITVMGATARGLKNPNSRTNSIQIFKKEVRKAKKHDFILLQIGEVDCGYLIWYRSKKFGESVKQQYQESLNCYFSFVKWLLEETTSIIILSSTVPPTIKDGEEMGELLNARKEISVSQIERTNLTLNYNNAIEQFCGTNSRLLYLEATQHFLDSTTNIVKDEYLNENPLDHHLSSKKSSVIWIYKLKSLLDNTYQLKKI